MGAFSMAERGELKSLHGFDKNIHARSAITIEMIFDGYPNKAKGDKRAKVSDKANDIINHRYSSYAACSLPLNYSTTLK